MEVENVSCDEIECGGTDSDDSGKNGVVADAINGVIKKPAPVGDGPVIKRKPKKVARQNSREGLSTINGINTFVAPQRRWKNSRRSRNGYGRGLPKKGGAGGKGVWGLPGSELLEEEDFEVDQNDPNYDAEKDVSNIELKEVIAEPTPEEFFKMAEPIILEYFENGDTHEVAISLDEILMGSLRPLATSVAVQIGLDHKESQREMVSVLISDLYGRVVTPKDIGKGNIYQKIIIKCFSILYTLVVLLKVSSRRRVTTSFYFICQKFFFVFSNERKKKCS